MTLPRSLRRRFRAIREIGSGGGGTVVLVEDLTGPPSPRALKLVRPRGGRTRASFLEREFEALRRLRHPGLVPVFDFGKDTEVGLLWFTSEFIPGPDLFDASALWPQDDLETALQSLASTLQFLHERSIVHNDLKPSNIRVPAGPESLRLLDFGMAASLGAGDRVGGTPAYMSPERLRRPDRPSSAASDLWALGVIFYRCATRVLPFYSDDPDGLLRLMDRGPVPARVLRPELPTFFEELLRRLLDPDPDHRFPNAAAILEALDGRAGARDRSSVPVLPAPPILGRDDVLATLAATWQRVRGGSPQGLVLVAEPGFGKSRLLLEWKQQIELDGHTVVAVAAHRGAPRAWGLLTDVARQLVARPDTPAAPPRIAALLAPDDRDTAQAVGDVAGGFTSWVRTCSASRPLALLIDDLGWGDAESVSTILALVQGPSADGRGAPGRDGRQARDAEGAAPGKRLPLLVGAGVRDEPGAESVVERCRRRGFEIVTLAALPERAQRDLVASLFPGGKLPAELIDEAMAQAAGNPLTLEQIARTWAETGAVRRAGGGWEIARGIAAPAGRRPLDLITARLRALPADRASILWQTAVHARPLRMVALEHLVPNAREHVAALERRGFVVERDSGVDVRHPLFREAAEALVPPGERAVLHRRMAEALAATGGGPAEIWQHELRGGATAAGLAHALLAGRWAEEAEDYVTGRAILEEALAADVATPGALDATEGRRLRVLLGRCLIETGGSASAVALLDQALRDAPRPERPAIQSPLARALLRLTERKRAEDVAREAQRLCRDPRLSLELATLLMWIIQDRNPECMDLVRAHLPVAESLEETPAAARSVISFYIACSSVEESATGPAAALVFIDRAHRLAERRGLTGLGSYMRLVRAIQLMSIGSLDDALRQFAEAEAEIDPDTARGRLLRRLQAHVLHKKGDTAEAVARLRRAAQEGDSMSRLSAQCLLADALADCADPEALVQACEAAREFNAGHRTVGLEFALAAGVRCAIWLGRRNELGDVDQALAGLVPANVTPQAGVHIDVCRAGRALLDGDVERGAQLLAEARRRSLTLDPVFSPLVGFDLAHALALAGRASEARVAALEAEQGFERHGNPVEVARARALARAIDGGRIGTIRPASHWLERMADPAESATVATDPGQEVVDRVARAVDATGAWLLAGDPRQPRVVARSGPCAAADPLAWREPVAAVLSGGPSAGRTGVGLVMPVEIGGTRSALVVEDRAFPQAFSDDAASVTRLVATAVLGDLAARRLASDLGIARRAIRGGGGLALASTQGRTLATLLPRTGKRVSRLAELTVGSLELHHPLDAIVGRSPPMRHTLKLLDRLVDVQTSVLLLGETGTGKEVVARLLHDKGPRRSGPFVAVNCSAVPDTMAESEFFGHAPGAFTGASRTRHVGYFEQASGGTLFLDEVGEMNLALQAKLLRAIEEREIRPLGGTQPVGIDVRIVAATNRDLRKDVARGRFRDDLYYRLAVVELKLPALREHRDDVPDLVRHLLRQMRPSPPKVSTQALDALSGYHWPGNVRELRNELERAVALSGGETIKPQHLSPAVRRAETAGRQGSGTTGLRDATDAFQRQMIADALKSARGVKARAARALGLSPVALHLRMQRLAMNGRGSGSSRTTSRRR